MIANRWVSPARPRDADVQLPLHPALHVFMPLVVQPVSVSQVPAARPQLGRATVRRYSLAASMISSSAANTLDPFAIRPGFPGLGPLRVLRPIPPASAGNGPLLPTNKLLAGKGTGRMVPTFTSQPFDRVGAHGLPPPHGQKTPRGARRQLPIAGTPRSLACVGRTERLVRYRRRMAAAI